MRDIAGGEHLFECGELRSGGGMVQVVFDGDPVDGVLAPIGAVIGLPVLGFACALRTIGAKRNGNQVLGVVEGVGVLFSLFG